MHPASVSPTSRLPACIPLCWTTADGQQLLAYPRSSADPHRYHVMRVSTGTMAGDTLAVVDDFGNLVETHMRSGYGFFHPIRRSSAPESQS